MYKRLIIAPHIGDESKINFDWVKQRPKLQERLNELNVVQTKLQFSYEILDNEVNTYTIQSLIPEFERIINQIQPDELYIPVPSYNQDHRVVYEAALTALRPHDLNFFVKKVFVYEQIQDLWNHNYHTFNPTYFRLLNIEEKINSYHLMKSQVRSFRNAEMIKNLAAIRGIQANVDFAEGFEVLRWIE
jgi:LmbE family N-acetylglucosaminyl deacetylase